jgi:hypothetical protein
MTGKFFGAQRKYLKRISIDNSGREFPDTKQGSQTAEQETAAYCRPDEV